MTTSPSIPFARPAGNCHTLSPQPRKPSLKNRGTMMMIASAVSAVMAAFRPFSRTNKAVLSGSVAADEVVAGFDAGADASVGDADVAAVAATFSGNGAGNSTAGSVVLGRGSPVPAITTTAHAKKKQYNAMN